jgi:hypothetical protein
MSPLRRIALILGVVAIVAVTSGAIGLVAAGDDDDDKASTTSTTEPESTTTTESATIDELEGDARELAELLGAGRQLTYHARYTGSSIGEVEGSITLESWAKDGRFRQDVAFAVGGVAVQRATFVLDDKGVSCQRSGDEPWECNELPKSQVEGADPLTGGTLAQLKKAAVGEAPGEVEGRSARCFTVSYDAQTTEMCLTPDGIPLQIRTTESRLVVEVLEVEVDDEVFTPPVTPVAAGGG